jgi:uncharacterized membrane protein YtjA (UPF0391 family)
MESFRLRLLRNYSLLGLMWLASPWRRQGLAFLYSLWLLPSPGGLLPNRATPAKMLDYALCENIYLKRKRKMLRWIIILVVIALVAAALGFGGIAGTAAGLARILFYVFLVLIVLALIFGRGRF